MIKKTTAITLSLLLMCASAISYAENNDSTFSSISNWINNNPEKVGPHSTNDGVCETQTGGIWAKLSLHIDGNYYAEFEDTKKIEELEKAIIVNGVLEVEVQNGRTFSCSN